MENIIICVLAYIGFGGYSIYIYLRNKQQKQYIEIVGKETYRNNKIWIILLIFYLAFVVLRGISIWSILPILPLSLAIYLYATMIVGIGKDGILYHNELYLYENIKQYHFGERGVDKTITIKGHGCSFKTRKLKNTEGVDTIEVYFPDHIIDEVHALFLAKCPEKTESLIPIYWRGDRKVITLDEEDDAFVREQDALKKQKQGNQKK